MNRDYSTGTHNDIDYFTGVEVEKTPAYGAMTLFVVGIKTVNEIIFNANAAKCEHIYLGANHSFKLAPETQINDLLEWSEMITALLERSGKLITLDFDYQYLNLLTKLEFMKHSSFIPQISIKFPNIQNLSYNTTIKLDDIDFNATNPGVWCHTLASLKSKESFTMWNEYTSDKPISSNTGKTFGDF